MNIITPSVQEIKQSYDLNGVFKQIAYAGRICYASEKNGDEKEFVDRLIKSKHFRPLEFGTIYLAIDAISTNQPLRLRDLLHNHWTKYKFRNGVYYITTNYRVIIENGFDHILQYICEPTKYHPIRRTFHFTIARSIADEMRTHVALSSLMESTRYCNYSKDRFGNELTFVKPHWVTSLDYDLCDENSKIFFKCANAAEYNYIKLIRQGCKAEQARDILPLSIKTEFIQCGFESDWEHFFDLRMRGTTGAPHPDAKYIAEKLYELYNTSK